MGQLQKYRIDIVLIALDILTTWQSIYSSTVLDSYFHVAEVRYTPITSGAHRQWDSFITNNTHNQNTADHPVIEREIFSLLWVCNKIVMHNFKDNCTKCDLWKSSFAFSLCHEDLILFYKHPFTRKSCVKSRHWVMLSWFVIFHSLLSQWNFRFDSFFIHV